MARKEISTEEKLMLMHARIQEKNLNDANDPIPRSDSMLKYLFSDLCDSFEQMAGFLQMLCDSHYLLSIRYVEPEPGLGIPATDGFVSTDYNVINKIYDYSQRHLERVYEGQFYRAKSANAILHELFPKISSYKNTPLGQALNEMIMVQQHQQIMKEDPSAYKTEWKEEKLRSLLKKGGGSGSEGNEFEAAEEADFDFTIDSGYGSGRPESKSVPESAPVSGMSYADPGPAVAGEELPGKGQRAVESPQYLEMEQMNTKGSWGQIYDKYGAEFLIRIHFRKHEFAEVRSLIRTKRIAREKDLRFIRDTLRDIEKRIPDSPDLQPWKNDITELRRFAQLKLNQILLARSGSLPQ